MQLKSERSQKTSSKETREGITYKSDVAFDDSYLDKETGCTTEIPPPTFPPDQTPLDCLSDIKTEIFFDLETTGLGRNSHITQVAAISNQDSDFSCYVLPERPISTKASEVTELKVRGQQLFHKGKPISSLSIKDALQSFVEYLKSHPGKVILIGHNIKVFDCHVLMNAIQLCHLHTQFCASTVGYLDTLLLFKLIKPGLDSYTQANLVKSLLDEDQSQYEAHNAFHDVRALQLLVQSQSMSTSAEVKMKATFGHNYVLDSLRYSNDIKVNIGSFDILVRQKVISNCIARRLAGSGLRYEHLAVVFHRIGEDGVRNLFTETNQGRLRVTVNKNHSRNLQISK